MNYSPAPWKWDYKLDHTDEMSSLIDGNGNKICDFGDSTQYYPTEGTEPNEADCKLIAAAPELLGALEKCISVLEQNSYFLLSEVNAIEQAKAAITKATLM